MKRIKTNERIWICHQESECVFIGNRDDLEKDGLLVEISECKDGSRREIERLLFDKGWSAKNIAEYNIRCDDDPPKEKLYMAGIEYEKDSFGMFAGPNPDINDVLDKPVPDDSKGKPIFVMDEDGNKTHRWHWGRMEWLKI